jgi:curved DNA-binding protein CbpA
MTQQGIEHSGRFDQYPLAELIRETAAAGLSGAFRLTRERVKSVIYFDSGELIFAVSNIRRHRLVECARQWNFVSAEAMEKVDASGSDVQVGAALVAAGALTEESLSELFSRQATDVLRPLYLWTDGSWSFDPRVRLVEDVRAQVSVLDLAIESARRLPPEFVIGRFCNSDETVTVEPQPPADVELQPIEGFVLSRIDHGGMSVKDLIAVSGLPEAESLRALYALSLGGFVTRNMWPTVFTEDKIARFRSANAAAKKAEQEEAIANPAGASATLPTAAAPPAAKAPKVQEPSPEDEERRELENFFSRLRQAQDYYDLLGVTRNTDSNAVKRAYHGLARRFHPDRFHQDAGTDLHAQLQTAFARIAQAYETLKDEQSRASYNLRLEGLRRARKAGLIETPPKRDGRTGGQQVSSPKKPDRPAGASTSSEPNEEAEKSFQRGLSALKAGNDSLALSYLGDAARRAPNHARYRAHYGKALAANSQSKHQAEAELKAAISLEADNASFRVMLAEFYFEMGMRRRAEAEAQRALVADAHNADAQRLIESLRST